MFVDASALTAILAPESDGEELEERLVAARNARTSPIAVFETAMALCRKRRMSLGSAETAILDYLDAQGVEIVSITSEIGRFALDARARYGKGSGHPAQLNLGDCFAYACAKAQAVPLLYKGDDFIHTDLA